MTSHYLATALLVRPGTYQSLLADGELSTAIDTLSAGDTWMAACVAAVREAPDWLRQQVGEHEHGALIPHIIADTKGPEARAVFLAQSAAAAAAGAWASDDAAGCMDLARRAARWWSAVEGLAYHAPAAPSRPLATLADSLQSERGAQDPRIWAPVEDMVLAADAAINSGTSEPWPSTRYKTGRPAVSRADTPTWIQEPTGAVAAMLVLEVIADGQPGLWRAFEAGLTVADQPFLNALQSAWDWATTRNGIDRQASVRWRLRLIDENENRAPAGNGDAIGLACAVGLQQLAVRHQRLHQLDRRTGYLGAVSTDGRVKQPTHRVYPDHVFSHTRSPLRRLITAKPQQVQPGTLTIRLASSVKEAVALGRRPVKARRAGLAATACVLAFAMTAAGVTAVRSGQANSRTSAAAASHARRAAAVALANTAQAHAGSDPPRAIAAAVAAYKLAPGDPTVTDAVIAATASDPRALRYLSPAATVKQLSLSGNGKLLAALLTTGKIEVWNLGTTTPRVLRIHQPPGITSAMGFLDGGPSLVAAGTAVSILNPISGATRNVGEARPGISALSVSLTSHAFVTASPTGVRLWNGATGASSTLSKTAASVVSLSPDGRTVLTGGASDTLRLLTATGNVAASTTLPSPATSVLLAPSGTAYTMTTAGRLYFLDSGLHSVRSTIDLPPDITLSLRPSTVIHELTPFGARHARRPGEIVATASNAALVFADNPAEIASGTGSNFSLNHVSVPIRSLGAALFATDRSGDLAATVLSDGQIRLSTIDLANGIPLRAQDVAAGAAVSHSTLALTSGLLYVSAYTALVNRRTGRISSLIHFTHAHSHTFQRPVIGAHYIVDTGSTTSSLDIWRIHGGRLTATAHDLKVSSTTIASLAIDDKVGLLFVAAGASLQARRLTMPARLLSQAFANSPIFCLTTVPASRMVYACTNEGIVAFTYSANGQLSRPKTVNTLQASALQVGPDNRALITLPAGDSILLPQGLGQGRRGNDTLTGGGAYILSSALTSTTAIVSGRSSELLLYSAVSGSRLADILLGGGEFATVLWPDGNKTISGATFDGSLFTLPPTIPSRAARYACTLLGNPRAEWQHDFGTSPAAAQLPATGGC